MNKPHDDSFYIREGFAGREDYLIHLSDDYGLPIEMVRCVANLYSDDEAFDGLIVALESASESYWELQENDE